MKAEYLKTAKMILRNNGDCFDDKHYKCNRCPADMLGKICPFNLEENPIEKIEWFKNYIAENEMEKIQITEEQAIEIFEVVYGINNTKSKI